MDSLFGFIWLTDTNMLSESVGPVGRIPSSDFTYFDMLSNITGLAEGDPFLWYDLPCRVRRQIWPDVIPVTYTDALSESIDIVAAVGKVYSYDVICINMLSQII